MRFISEVVETKETVLIVNRTSSLLVHALKKKLTDLGNEVFISPQVPPTVSKFHYLFIVNDQKSATQPLPLTNRVIFLFLHQKKKAELVYALVQKQARRNTKIVSISDDTDNEQILERLLWFSFSKSNEMFLHIESFAENRLSKKTKSSRRFDWKEMLTFKRVLLAGIIALVAAHFLMVPFLMLSSFLYVRAASSFTQTDLSKTERYLYGADRSLSIARAFYTPTRQTYLFFSFSPLPDTIFSINEKAKESLHTGIDIYENGNQLFQLILNKHKVPQEKQQLLTRVGKLRTDFDTLEDNLVSLEEKLPNWHNLQAKKTQVAETIASIDKTKRVLPYLETILAKGTTKKYLLLFANNMELRPGGGFIGSFGVLTMNDLTLQDIQVFDVYDADGQLTTHVDPPDAIRRFLQQPHWFLRDSAFSSDFFENYNEAKFFLNQELHLNEFSGGTLITTSAIQNLLGAFKNVYIPDFNEIITKDNFYIKAQLYAEKGFFPGSTQKKNFLGSLAKQILLDLDSVSAPALMKEVAHSLDEKQIVVIFDDSSIQTVLDSLYWSGKTISPQCAPKTDNCVVDYIQAVDANLGVNKANFYVSRSILEKVRIGKDGQVSNSFILTLRNDSPNDVFPGGTYKNYFQVFLPKDVSIQQITRDQTAVERVDQRINEFTILGFYFELPPQRSTEIRIDYRLGQTLESGNGTYQLVMQKQTGSKNSDVNLEIALPENVSLVQQNFSPLVKDNRIFYNTSLNADKLFLIELTRK